MYCTILNIFRSSWGTYSTEAKHFSFCRSDKYEDELTWGAAWLFRITNDTKYLTWAEQYYITGPDWGQSWDDKYSGNMVNCLWEYDIFGDMVKMSPGIW